MAHIQSWREDENEDISVKPNGDNKHGRKNKKSKTKKADKDCDSKVSCRKINSSNRFDHPVFNSISKENGLINRMCIDEVTEKLSCLGLNEKGKIEVLQKRLKNHVKTEKLLEAKIELDEKYKSDYFVVIDFEATCEKNNPSGFIQEIIEFPAVLVDVKKQENISEFHSYCKPVINTQLTAFCTQLTGIEQSMVDSAPTFPTVLQRFDEWLKQELEPTDLFAVLTDGPWDVSRFLIGQCKQCHLELPHYFKTWVNIRRHFGNHYKIYRANLDDMLTILGMEFIGRPHSGIDDARNIARIAIQMLKDGCTLKINDTC